MNYAMAFSLLNIIIMQVVDIYVHADEDQFLL